MGLTTVLVGEGHDPVFRRLGTRSDLTVLRAASTAEALTLVDGSEPAIVLLPVLDVDVELSTLTTLVSRGAQVVMLANAESPGIRVAAFSAGVTDVLFPPFDPWFVEEVVATLSGNPLRKDVRCPTQMETLLVPFGGVALPGHLVSLSIGELRARVSGSLPPGAILRVALKPPAPHRLPVLFARVKRTDTLDDGRLDVQARFIGITSDELRLLGGFLEQQPAEVEDVATVVSQIDAIDVEFLRRGDRTTIGGHNLPTLTPPEAAWVHAAPATLDAKLATVAVARVRAELTVALLEAVGTDIASIANLPIVRYQAELTRARGMLEAAQVLFAASPRELADLAALTSRLADASSALERGAAQLNAAAEIQVPPVAPPVSPAPPTEPPALAAPPASASQIGPQSATPPVIARSGDTDPRLKDPTDPTLISPPMEPAETTSSEEDLLLLNLSDEVAVEGDEDLDAPPSLAGPVPGLIDDSKTVRTVLPLDARVPRTVPPASPDTARTNPGMSVGPIEDRNTSPGATAPEPPLLGPRPATMPPPPTIPAPTPGVAGPRTLRRKFRNPFLENE